MPEVPRRQRFATLASAALILATSGAALGQPAGSTAPAQPTPATPTTPKKDAPAPPPSAPAKPPVRSIPRQPAPDPNPAPISSIPKVRVASRRGQVLPEGTFLVSRHARMVPGAREGDWVLHFVPDARGGVEAPMTLLPCATLDAMQRAAGGGAGAGSIDFVVSGQVFAYRGQNYLLPVHTEATAAAPVEPMLPAVGPESEPAADAPAPTPTDAPPAPAQPEDEAQRRIRELERNTRERPRIVVPALTPNSPSITITSNPTATNSRVAPERGHPVSEGIYLASRRGRLVREDDGRWVFRFDADANGQADPPMLVLPCANLEAMEQVAARVGDSIAYTVSGQVFAYQGRNYLLPTLFLNERANQDLLPRR